MSHALCLVISSDPESLIKDFGKFTTAQGTIDYFKKLQDDQSLPLSKREYEEYEGEQEEIIVYKSNCVSVKDLDKDQLIWYNSIYSILTPEGFLTMEMFKDPDEDSRIEKWKQIVTDYIEALENDQIVSLYDYHK